MRCDPLHPKPQRVAAGFCFSTGNRTAPSTSPQGGTLALGTEHRSPMADTNGCKPSRCSPGMPSRLKACQCAFPQSLPLTSATTGGLVSSPLNRGHGMASFALVKSTSAGPMSERTWLEYKCTKHTTGMLRFLNFQGLYAINSYSIWMREFKSQHL